MYWYLSREEARRQKNEASSKRSKQNALTFTSVDGIKFASFRLHGCSRESKYISLKFISLSTRRHKDIKMFKIVCLKCYVLCGRTLVFTLVKLRSNLAVTFLPSSGSFLPSSSIAAQKLSSIALDRRHMQQTQIIAIMETINVMTKAPNQTI